MTTGRSRRTPEKTEFRKAMERWELEQSPYGRGRRSCQAFAICAFFLSIIIGLMLASKPYAMTHGNGFTLLVLLFMMDVGLMAFALYHFLQLKHLPKK